MHKFLTRTVARLWRGSPKWAAALLVPCLIGDPITVMVSIGPVGAVAIQGDCPKSGSIGWKQISIAGGHGGPPLQCPFASQALALTTIAMPTSSPLKGPLQPIQEAGALARHAPPASPAPEETRSDAGPAEAVIVRGRNGQIHRIPPKEVMEKAIQISSGHRKKCLEQLRLSGYPGIIRDYEYWIEYWRLLSATSAARRADTRAHYPSEEQILSAIAKNSGNLQQASNELQERGFKISATQLGRAWRAAAERRGHSPASLAGPRAAMSLDIGSKRLEPAGSVLGPASSSGLIDLDALEEATQRGSFHALLFVRMLKRVRANAMARELGITPESILASLLNVGLETLEDGKHSDLNPWGETISPKNLVSFLRGLGFEHVIGVSLLATDQMESCYVNCDVRRLAERFGKEAFAAVASIGLFERRYVGRMVSRTSRGGSREIREFYQVALGQIWEVLIPGGAFLAHFYGLNMPFIKVAKVFGFLLIALDEGNSNFLFVKPHPSTRAGPGAHHPRRPGATDRSA